jgi:cytochrome b561
MIHLYWYWRFLVLAGYLMQQARGYGWDLFYWMDR